MCLNIWSPAGGAVVEVVEPVGGDGVVGWKGGADPWGLGLEV